MSRQSNTPSDVSVFPRNREHDVADALARDWFDGHPFKTAWYNSMSITFPLGEKFFIDSVRAFADRVSDPKLQEEIRGFCGQEGFHRREHDRYNHTLCSLRGYDLEYLEGRLAKKLAFTRKMLSPLEQLAVTAALEHITAILAESGLDQHNPHARQMDPTMRALWDWHAVEELEHKSVAFDVYRAMGGRDKMRRKVMRRATLFLLLDFTVGAAHMLRRDGKLWRPRLWLDGFRFLFGRNGVYRRVWPAYRQWFRDGFHPWQRDTRDLLTSWQQAQTAAQ
jgi:predicted metal-dependent hydrolase